MKAHGIPYFFAACCGVALLLARPSGAQWAAPIYEAICQDPGADYLAQSSLAVDDSGKLYMIYRHGTGAECAYYCRTKPLGGQWSPAVQVGDPGATDFDPYLTVNKSTGTAYMAYVQGGVLKLASLSGGIWTYTTLPTPGAASADEPAAAVDNAGNVHVACIADIGGGNYHIGYGYWDGQAFHFQLLLTAYPIEPTPISTGLDLCAKSLGGVAISYSHISQCIHVIENNEIGSTVWEDQQIDGSPGQLALISAIQASAENDLALAFAMTPPLYPTWRVAYTQKPAGAPSWEPYEIISPPQFPGTAPRLALEDGLTAHVVYTLTSGFVGMYLCYATNECGDWITQHLMIPIGYNASFVLDGRGNGSVVFEQMNSMDMNVYYYGCVSVGPAWPNVDVVLDGGTSTPLIPPGGGSFSFDVHLANNQSIIQAFDVWIMVQLPNGTWYGPVLGPINLTLPSGATLVRQRTQFVPGAAPAGVYTYRAYVGDYPDSIWDGSSLFFEKQSSGDHERISGWSNIGESLTDGESGFIVSTALNQAFSIVPNPFNANTLASFELRVPSRVSLRVYDTTGRLVETLVDGWRGAGRHEVTFGGSDLASGIYIYRLEVSGSGMTTAMASGKMVLLK